MDKNKLIIQELIKNRAETPDDLAVIKRKAAKKYKISCPSNIELLKAYHKLVKDKRIKKFEGMKFLLKTRPIRSLSGIINVSVLTKPYPCPGKCIYCPAEKNIPKSYLSGEPAVERAKRLNYNPYLQVQKRIEMLENEGHPADKIELRIIGGTWSYYLKKYQIWFVKRCFDACNKTSGKDLKKSQKINEKAKHRVVGLSIETRPDFINPSEIKRLRELGATMVEIGVQSVYDNVLNLNKRGHKVKDTIEATKLLKDAGFKVCYQMMLNLPGSDLKKDREMFKELFSNPDFQPDLLKIYPTALLKEAPLYKWWKDGKYKPYDKNQLINLVKSIKKKIPYYVRIQRIARDIPSQSIIVGPAKISNLRQIISKDSKKEGWQCHCIRCREVKENYNPKEKLKLFRENYDASDGKEIFLSFESEKREKLYSLLRLRISSQNTAMIREIHTYGQLVPISKTRLAPQHQGLGKKLIKQAEKIAKKEFGFHPVKFPVKSFAESKRKSPILFNRDAKQFNRVNKIAVISGIGVRNYFKELGYRLENTYMVKYFEKF